MTGFLIVAASAGFASLLTPCVVPVVPLTIGYFAGRRRATGETPVLEAGLFAGGIILTFTGLGLALSMLVGASGVSRFAANPWLNLFVALVFVTFALNLLGVFSIRLPGKLITRADSAARTAPRLVAPLLTGFAFTLATFACTAPFVGPLLVAASAGEWTRPLVGMLIYSAAFALPFFVLGLAPSWLDRVPRSGRWTTDLRIVIAAVQLAVALKFLSDATFVWGWGSPTREGVLTAWMLLALAAAVTILARGFAGQSRRPVPLRLVASGTMLIVGGWLWNGRAGQPLGELEALLPPRLASADVHLPWIVNDLETGLALARSEGRPVFVDFTGYTCGNCRWMESNVFTRVRVRDALAPFVLVRLFTDGDGYVFHRNQRLQEERFGTVALPLYAVLNQDGSARASFVGVARNVDAFVGFIEGAAGQ